jgi:UDP-N-acetylglucosamine 2-epimerase (non-hydrolysing)
MLDQVLKVFEVLPDVDLGLMEEDQTLSSFTARAVSALDDYLSKHRPDLVIVQGDTTTTFCAALASFYHHIPVAHVEAGLRTWRKDAPFPEEMNRVLTSRLTDIHFAPTETARQNLLKERVPNERIFVTGNTVVDALLFAVDKVRTRPPEIPGLSPRIMDSKSHRRMVLITGHRRESFGQGFRNICGAISELATQFQDVDFVYPVHLNPNVRQPVFQLLSGKDNIFLIEPQEYLPFVALMDRCTLILTDSGGIQEEAPSLGKPVLVMRDVTERPEAIAVGTAKLVGTDFKTIVAETSRLLTDKASYNSMLRVHNPYGDGQATGRIIGACQEFFGKCSPKP